MIIVLLLIIIAIMLLGSSRFIGIVGIILAAIVGIIAVGMIMTLWQSLSTISQWIIGGIGGIGFLALWGFQQGLFTSLADARRQNALDTWQHFDKSIIDRFSKAAMDEALAAINRGDEKGLRVILQAERARIRRESERPSQAG